MNFGAARLGFWFRDSPVEQFINLNFEEGTLGWTIVTSRIRLNGGSTLAGWPTPSDPDPFPNGSPGDVTAIDTMPGFSYTLDTVDKPPLGEVQSMRLTLGGSPDGVVSAGAIMFGPAIYSNNSVTFKVGDTMAFDWRAVPGSDAYNIEVYMVEQSTGAIIQLLRGTGVDASTGTPWATFSRVIGAGEAGNYKFVFISGSFDSTFGTVIGGSLLIDNIRRIRP